MNLSQAVLIGHELAGIESAIDQGKIAFTNAGGQRWEYYSSPLFTELADRRETLRADLLSLSGAVPSSKRLGDE